MKKYMQPALVAVNVENENILAGSLGANDEVGNKIQLVKRRHGRMQYEQFDDYEEDIEEENVEGVVEY